MGASDFVYIASSAALTMDEAFDEGRREALHEYGHGGYTGTIAEKDGYVKYAVAVDHDDVSAFTSLLAECCDADQQGTPIVAIPVPEPYCSWRRKVTVAGYQHLNRYGNVPPTDDDAGLLSNRDAVILVAGEWELVERTEPPPHQLNHYAAQQRILRRLGSTRLTAMSRIWNDKWGPAVGFYVRMEDGARAAFCGLASD